MESNNYVNGVIVEYIEGIEVIKAFNQSSGSYEKYAKAVKAFKDQTLRWYKSTWKIMNFISSVLPSTFLGTLPIGMYLYMKGSLAPQDLIISLILSLGIVEPLMKFTTYVNETKTVEYAIHDVDRILSVEKLEDAEKEVDIKGCGIELENVSFSYDKDGGKQILSNIDLSIKEGDFTALVGPSGGGKSTIAKLIARFYDVTDGAIKIGGNDIRKIPLSQLADMVSFVTQDNFLFNCSIKENIRLGDPNADDEKVYAAAKAACCDEFIQKLENGYDTSAGDAGNRLSGGEKQRISIARMILKNSPIVILDEATAFTDQENEEKIQKSIAALTKGKTLLVIAHRLSTIKNADKIILLKNGKIKNTGTHDELLDNDALYREMWEAHIGIKKSSAV
jgi:ATP-binding cassette subfamily B protein